MRGIIYQGDGPELVDDLELVDVRPGEVKVDIESAGLCHSDVSVLDGTIPFPTPVVLGHEGAGVVSEVGDGVTSVQPGDHVVLSTVASCGTCAQCSAGKPTHCANSTARFVKPFRRGDQKLFQFAAAGTFAEQTIVTESQAIKIDPEIGFDVASLIGCGVITGVGAVLNRAKVQAGESAVVIGAGGIGLNVIQGLRLARANPIIAIDANRNKETLARQFGATEFVLAEEGIDTVAAAKELSGGGVDYAFECVGHPALIKQSTEMLGTGGNTVIIGVPPLGTEASFTVFGLYHDKGIMGCRYGTARPHHDFPFLATQYQAGNLMLDELVSATYDLADFDKALDALHEGNTARGVLHP